MKRWFILPLALLVVAAEPAILRPFGLSVARIDLHIAFIVFLALRFPTLSGAFATFFIGYAVDALSGMPTGLYILASVVAFLLARLLAPFLEDTSFIAFIPLAGLADLVHNLIVIAGDLLASLDVSQARHLIRALPMSALLTMIAAALLWPLLAGMDRALKKPESAGLLL